MTRIGIARLGAAALLIGCVAGPAPALGSGASELSGVALDIRSLREDGRALAVEVAQAQQLPQNYAAQVEVRLLELERRLQALTGQIEELQHRTGQVDDRLDRALADIEFRLNQLEGGAGAGPSGQAAPAPDAPPEAAGVPGTPSAPPPGRPPGRSPDGGSVAPQTFDDGTGTLGTLTFRTPSDDAGDAGTDARGSGFAGPTRLAPQTGADGSAGGQPPPRTGETAALPGGTPAEDYQAAYRLLQQGDYAAAETALQQFLASHGEHPLASNAQYWLGETYYVRGRYDDAASAFARGYQRFPDGAKAVDNLLKLGMSLARLDRRDDACVALTRIATEFPDGPIAVQRRAESEAERLGCP